MNPVIEHLLEQCGGLPTDSDGKLLSPMLLGEFRVNHFAELVASECALLVEHLAEHHVPASDYAQLIRQHFGLTHENR